MLTRRAMAAGVMWAVAACAGAPPSAPPPTPASTVVARWVADDGSVVAVNVVLGPDTDRRRLADLARDVRDEHPGARVRVTYFADTAGPERYVIGHVPSAPGDPRSIESRGPAWLATFDFPGSPPPSGDRERIDGEQDVVGRSDVEASPGQ